MSPRPYSVAFNVTKWSPGSSVGSIDRLGTSKEEFDGSFTYWSSRPAEFKVMHEYILNELSRRKDELAQ